MADQAPSETSRARDRQDDVLEDEALEDEYLDYADLIKPWDPKQIRITTKTFSIREVYNQILEARQTWLRTFSANSCESGETGAAHENQFFSEMPIPAFYLNQDSIGAFQVVDGVQRLTTIKLPPSGTSSR